MTRLFEENPCARDAVSTEEITNALAAGTRVKVEKAKEKAKKKAEKEIQKVLEGIIKKVVKKAKNKK